MLTVPEEIKNLFRQDNIREQTSRKWKLRFFDSDIRLIFPEDVLFPADELFPVDQEPIYVIDNMQMVTESLILTESLCESEDLSFGECNAAQLEVTVADVLLDLTDKEFMVTVEVGDYEMAMGIYTVDSFIRQADKRLKKITAYDRMRRFQTDVSEWYQSLKFPLTLKAFRDSLCSYVGIIQLDIVLPLDEMQITKTIGPEQLSGLDVIQAICEINGCFGHMDKTGRFKYQYLTQASLFPSEILMPDDKLFPSGMNEEDSEMLSYYKQTETTYEDYVVSAIERIQIRQEEGDVGAIYGKEGNCYIIQGNFLVYGKSAEELLQIAANIYDYIAGRVYRPCKIVSQALPWVEAGDGLICYTSDDVIETYCLKRTMKGIQGMMDSFEAFGNIKQEENFGFHTQIIQLEGKTAVIKKSVDEVSVKVTDLKNYTESQFKVTAEQIAAEVKRAQESEAALSLKADQISLSVTNLKNDTNSKFEQTAEQISLKVSKGDVSAQLSIEPGQVRIAGNRLIVDSTNFKLDSAGNATFSGDVRGANINGSNITGGYIEGSVIDVGPLYADEDQVQIGDFYVSTDGSNSLTSRNGSVELSSRSNSNVPYIVFKEGSERTYVGSDGIETDSVISCYALRADDDVRIKNGWTKYWSCSEMFDELYDSISDRRLKNSIDYLDNREALEALLKVNPCLFKYNEPVNPHRTRDDWQLGVIAQDVIEPLMQYPIVTTAQDGFYRVNYEGFIPLLISSVKELFMEIKQIRKV